MHRSVRLAFLVVTTVLAAGCSSAGPNVAAGPSTTAPTTTAAPGPSTAPSPEAPAATGQGVPVMRYFIRDGVVGTGERYVVNNTDPKLDALKALANPLTDVEKAAGLTTGIPELKDPYVKSLTVADGVATIDVVRPFETRDTQLQVAQVVYTLTQFPDIKKVKFLVEGLDNGATGVPPVGRDGLGTRIPDLLLDSPWPNQQSPRSVKVSGDVDPKYSSFDYRVENAFGQELTKGSITVKFGTDRKKFDQIVELPAGTTGAVNFIVTPPTGSKQLPFKVPFTVTG